MIYSIRTQQHIYNHQHPSMTTRFNPILDYPQANILILKVIICAHYTVWDPILYTECAKNNYKSYLRLKYCRTGCSTSKTIYRCLQ
jgi:hypothetical protein